MKQEERSPLGFYTIGIAALFLAGFFLLVVFGAQSDRNTVSGQNDNMRSRALLSYFSTTVKGYDTAGAVSVRDSDYGQVLVIEDGGSGYGLRIYQYQGSLVEDYASLASALSPEEAQVIGETATFALRFQRDDLLSIETDVGNVLLHLRSEGGGT